MTAVNLNSIIYNVTNGYAVSPAIRQIQDSNIIVTGGHLEKIDSTYYLIFGHRFDGMYSKITGSTLFVQTYSNSIRKFNIHDDGTSLSIANYTTVTDTDNFHRRDLNVAEQIFPNGEYGYTAFGGVFQKNATLPFLTPIDITSANIQHNSGFNQNLNQYETALMPVYDSINNFMHSVFFGGMSLYTYDTINNILVQDTLVPFVNTISKVSRDGAGNLTEYKLPVEMPTLSGTNARFIPDPTIMIRHQSIVDLNSLSGNTRVGWIVNGIESDLPNIADLDPESMSRPSAMAYEVWVDVAPDQVHDLPLTNTILGLNVYPNPTSHTAYIDFIMNESGKTSVEVLDATGKVLKRYAFKGKKSEMIHIPVSTSFFSEGLYTCIIKTEHGMKAARFIVR